MKENLFSARLDKDLEQRLAESGLVPPEDCKDLSNHKFKHHQVPTDLEDQVLHFYCYEGEDPEEIAKRLELNKSDILRILTEAGAI